MATVINDAKRIFLILLYKRLTANIVFFAKVSHSEVAHSACGADERGTQPLYEHVSHSNPRESVFSVGLVWDTLAKMTVGYLAT